MVGGLASETPMVVGRMSDDFELAAGDFAAWLGAMQAALRGEADAEVPCGDCSACCTSSQFVPIGPEETDTLAHIPKELLFPAPGRDEGLVLLPYDERGHCPMLVGGRCSIYEHRPRTCRIYDCRIFSATGLEVDAEAESKADIAARAARWRFTFPGHEDRRRQEAVRVAVRTVRATSVTELAVKAIESHEDYLPGLNRPPG